jgi:hypothetical protein
MLIGLDRDRAFYPTVLIYDLTAAGFLAWTLHRSSSLSQPPVRAGS